MYVQRDIPSRLSKVKFVGLAGTELVLFLSAFLLGKFTETLSECGRDPCWRMTVDLYCAGRTHILHPATWKAVIDRRTKQNTHFKLQS